MNRSRSFVAGLVICAFLGVLDLVGLLALVLGADGPPFAVGLGGAALGVLTLVGVALAWRGGSRGGLITVIVSRVLDALLAVPVFFADAAPDWARVVVGISIVFAVVGVGLIAGVLRQPQVAAPTRL
jgi:hypothetical protein